MQAIWAICVACTAFLQMSLVYSIRTSVQSLDLINEGINARTTLQNAVVRKEEAIAAGMTQEQFQEADENGDGQLDRKEFVAATAKASAATKNDDVMTLVGNRSKQQPAHGSRRRSQHRRRHRNRLRRKGEAWMRKIEERLDAIEARLDALSVQKGVNVKGGTEGITGHDDGALDEEASAAAFPKQEFEDVGEKEDAGIKLEEIEEFVEALEAASEDDEDDEQQDKKEKQESASEDESKLPVGHVQKDALSSWPSGHQVIFIQSASSVNVNFVKASRFYPQWNPTSAFSKVVREFQKTCENLCACLPYVANSEGKLQTSSCSDHGKYSERSNNYRDRLLSTMGVTTARNYGDYLRRQLLKANISIKKFLVSPARRTLHTMLLAFGHVMDDNIEVVPALHETYRTPINLPYDGRTVWQFTQAVQRHLTERNHSFISNNTLAELEAQLTAEGYTKAIEETYTTNPESLKICKERETYKKLYTQCFYHRMSLLRKKLLSMEKGTYVIISHQDIGMYFFPDQKLGSLATIIGELNGNANIEQVFHSFGSAAEKLPQN